MAISIQQTRCLLHPVREAVARCKGCEEYFCRECVGEHDGEMLCASFDAKGALSACSCVKASSIIFEGATILDEFVRIKKDKTVSVNKK